MPEPKVSVLHTSLPQHRGDFSGKNTPAAGELARLRSGGNRSQSLAEKSPLVDRRSDPGLAHRPLPPPPGRPPGKLLAERARSAQHFNGWRLSDSLLVFWVFSKNITSSFWLCICVWRWNRTADVVCSVRHRSSLKHLGRDAPLSGRASSERPGVPADTPPCPVTEGQKRPGVPEAATLAEQRTKTPSASAPRCTHDHLSLRTLDSGRKRADSTLHRATLPSVPLQTTEGHLPGGQHPDRLVPPVQSSSSDKGTLLVCPSMKPDGILSRA